MHKAPQQYRYISEKAYGKPCLFICSGLQVQIASANLFGTNAIINICKCQRWSSWLILYYFLFSALKWYSAVLFKSNLVHLHTSTCKCTKFKSFLLFSSFSNSGKNQQPDSREEASLYYHCIHLWKKNAINNFRLQNW